MDENFFKKNQFHSCVSISIENHFKNKPSNLIRILSVLRKNIEKFGQIRIDAVKTEINFEGKSHFAVLKVLKDILRLEFVLNRKIKTPLLIRIKGPTSEYYTYVIKLKDLSDINKELLEWLRESYLLRNK